jgi:membrane fusion protein (multidrug efflux system)
VTAFVRVAACLLVLSGGFGSVASAQEAGSQPEIRAQLTPRDFTTLAAEIGAKIERLTVREGDRFRKGQILVSFDCSLQQAQVDEARASLVAAERTVAVNRRLLELKAIGTLENDLSIAEVDKARARVAEGTAVTAKCAVAAPFDGRVVEQKARAQQFVQPGQPLLDILDDSALELELVIPSKWLVWLKTGYTFQVTIDETAKTYPVTLTRIGARIDPVSQTVKVVGVIGGSHPELVSGMSGRVLLNPP